MIEALTIVLLAAVAWLWLDSLKVREAAVRAAKDVCAAEGLQFLDDTVSIAGFRPGRGGERGIEAGARGGRAEPAAALLRVRVQRHRQQPPQGPSRDARAPAGGVQ